MLSVQKYESDRNRQKIDLTVDINWKSHDYVRNCRKNN